MTLAPVVPGQPVTIAIPTKNRHAYLVALLTSLLPQTYRDWRLVINDSSDPPIESHAAIGDLLRLIDTSGHRVRVIHTSSGWDRHQRAMEAAPSDADLILRVDDDVVMTPSCVEHLVTAMAIPLDRPTAAVGGCYPEPWMKPIDLNQALTDPEWAPRLLDPAWAVRGWRLQGHSYRQRQLLEVDHLLGHAICYRRRAVEEVGGWAVPGYSQQAHREESDLCARLVAAGYALAVTTDALAHHLMSPSGGSREISKSPAGNVLMSDRAPIEADNRLFDERLRRLAQGVSAFERPLLRYELDDIVHGIVRPLRIRSVDHVIPMAKKAIAPIRARLRPLRRLWRRWRAGDQRPA